MSSCNKLPRNDSAHRRIQAGASSLEYAIVLSIVSAMCLVALANYDVASIISLTSLKLKAIVASLV